MHCAITSATLQLPCVGAHRHRHRDRATGSATRSRSGYAGHGEHEADLILKRPDRTVVALEVKLGSIADDASVKDLRWLRERLGDQRLDTAVVTTGARAYRRKDGVAVIPAALLGP